MDTFDSVYDLGIGVQDSDFDFGDTGTDGKVRDRDPDVTGIVEKGRANGGLLDRPEHGSTFSCRQADPDKNAPFKPASDSRSKKRSTRRSESNSGFPESNDARNPLDLYCAEIRRLKSLKPQDEEGLQIASSECSEKLFETIARFPGSAHLILESRKNSSSGLLNDTKRKQNDLECGESSPEPLYDAVSLMEPGEDDGPGEQASRSASMHPGEDSELVQTVCLRFSEFQESIGKFGIAHETTLEHRVRLKVAFLKLSLTPLAIKTLVERMESLLEAGYAAGTPGALGNSGSFGHRKFVQIHGLSFDEFEGIAQEASRLYREWQQVRNRVAEVHVGLVFYLARQYSSDPQDLIDLIQEGNIGLLKAVERFNYRLGFRFSTYATYWIRLAISRYLARSSRAVRLPYRQNLHIGTVRKKRESFEQRHGRAPSTLELARDTGISEAGLRKLELMSQAATSLDAQFESTEGLDLISVLEQQTFSEPAEIVESQKVQGLIEKAIDGLNQREAYVIRERFGIGVYTEKTLQELGAILGLTRERVRQIESGALKKIRRWLEPLAV